jgi:hypothetical protein
MNIKLMALKISSLDCFPRDSWQRIQLVVRDVLLHIPSELATKVGPLSCQGMHAEACFVQQTSRPSKNLHDNFFLLTSIES